MRLASLALEAAAIKQMGISNIFQNAINHQGNNIILDISSSFSVAALL